MGDGKTAIVTTLTNFLVMLMNSNNGINSLSVTFSAPCVFSLGATDRFLESFNDNQIPDFIEGVKCHTSAY